MVAVTKLDYRATWEAIQSGETVASIAQRLNATWGAVNSAVVRMRKYQQMTGSQAPWERWPSQQPSVGAERRGHRPIMTLSKKPALVDGWSTKEPTDEQESCVHLMILDSMNRGECTKCGLRKLYPFMAYSR